MQIRVICPSQQHTYPALAPKGLATHRASISFQPNALASLVHGVSSFRSLTLPFSNTPASAVHRVFLVNSIPSHFNCQTSSNNGFVIAIFQLSQIGPHSLLRGFGGYQVGMSSCFRCCAYLYLSVPICTLTLGSTHPLGTSQC